MPFVDMLFSFQQTCLKNYIQFFTLFTSVLRTWIQMPHNFAKLNHAALFLQERQNVLSPGCSVKHGL